jgi:hypothetical protein
MVNIRWLIKDTQVHFLQTEIPRQSSVSLFAYGIVILLASPTLGKGRMRTGLIVDEASRFPTLDEIRVLRLGQCGDYCLKTFNRD